MFLTALIFLLILSVMVFVHELGHFLMAKRAGIAVEEFGFGLPPRVWGKKIGNTLYSLNALPLGGFVKLYGEDGEEDRSQIQKTEIKGRAFYEASLWQRLRVLLAGVFMNLVLAIVCFSVVYYSLGIPTYTGKVMVTQFAEGSAAQAAGLKVDDIIVTAKGEKITRAAQLSQIAQANIGQPLTLEIQRGETPLVITVTPRAVPAEKAGLEGPLGVYISDSVLSKNYPFWQMPFLGAKEGFKESIAWGGRVLAGLRSLIVTALVKKEVPRDVAGPIGMFQLTGQAAEGGLLALISLTGILSVNLAIMNVLPLPALDGGRLIFLGYEAVTRRRPNPKVEGWVNMLGMAFLLGLMALISLNDILRIVRK